MKGARRCWCTQIHSSNLYILPAQHQQRRKKRINRKEMKGGKKISFSAYHFSSSEKGLL